MVQPQRASSKQMERPIPLLAPVTIAVRFSKFIQTPQFPLRQLTDAPAYGIARLPRPQIAADVRSALIFPDAFPDCSFDERAFLPKAQMLQHHLS